jgi:vacuolar-type H+-ATPase subunit I/STV1
MTDFFVELLVRLFSKTPWFFKVVQIISAVALVITGLPQLLVQAGVEIPEAWTGTLSQVVSIASMVAIFLAQLTTTTKVKEVEKLKD